MRIAVPPEDFAGGIENTGQQLWTSVIRSDKCERSDTLSCEGAVIASGFFRELYARAVSQPTVFVSRVCYRKFSSIRRILQGGENF